MLDFLQIAKKTTRNGVEIYPKFIVKNSKDLMIRGKAFYAIWDEENGLWSTDVIRACELIDDELDKYALKKYDDQTSVFVQHLWDTDTKMIDKFNKYCEKQMPSNQKTFHTLDEKVIFSNTDVKKTDYVSKKLSYAMEDGEPEAWNEMLSVLYSPEEKKKLEWAIGAIISGDSKKIQKFIVLYGAPNTGKSTVINIIEKLFDGYYSAFDAKVLGSSSNSFALEAFRNNPLIAIQHDGNLSKIEDNTRLNSLVSHEDMMVNEKFKSAYTMKFNAFLILGTNNPVKISDARSGILRRLIDVSPTGNKVPRERYEFLNNQIEFELGKIANHCLNIYKNNKRYYDSYRAKTMMSATNDFYNFITDEEVYFIFLREDSTTLKKAWALYKDYCERISLQYKMPYTSFGEELKNYFYEFRDIDKDEDGNRVRSRYIGFKKDIFENKEEKQVVDSGWIKLKRQPSLFDDILKNCKAQYANHKGKPLTNWNEVTTTVGDISTGRLHYCLLPDEDENNYSYLIVIDFDIHGEDGEKSLEENIKAATLFPKTYVETSQSGKGLHLHYWYVGDVSKLSTIYGPNIEIKKFKGLASLRRKVSMCNDIPIAKLSSGLPVIEGAKTKGMQVEYQIENERHLFNLIRKALNKEIGVDPSNPEAKAKTVMCIKFIRDILNKAYESGISYDLRSLQNSVYLFASHSSNNKTECINIVKRQMHFNSKDREGDTEDIKEELEDKERYSEDARITFFDTEVFKNYFLLCWKYEDEECVHRMPNPTPSEVEKFVMSHKLVGFNCKAYDNIILYWRMLGFDNLALYKISKAIINKEIVSGAYEAKNISYMDIFDASSEKKSLKKFEIMYKAYHKELNWDWDEEVPENMFEEIASYCENDVRATELVWKKRQSDVKARLIMSDISGLCPNESNNNMTAATIFKGNKNPQSEFNYRFLGDTSDLAEYIVPGLDCDWEWTRFDSKGRPVFVGYEYKNGRSTYRGEEIGEGGYVYAEPGIYENVALLDIASMHPSSIIAEKLFGERYTKVYADILQTRLYIKHKEFDKAKELFGGVFAKYLNDTAQAKELSTALKIPLNSTYGLTDASFKNPFRDDRNIDNIVAKRGALFMNNLKHEVQRKGFTVAHIKTDSIKIPNATPEIIQFVMDYGKLYGYTFEHEDTYEKMCLVNDAVYIAKTKEPYKDKETGDMLYWKATGKQFQVPYVFKTLFTHQHIDFYDMCETISVSSSLYLDMNYGLRDVTDDEKELKKVLKYTPDDKKAIDILRNRIKDGHNYKFVGRVGLFTPIDSEIEVSELDISNGFIPVKNVCHGGYLMRKSDNGYSYASGTKGFRWLEAEDAKVLCDLYGMDKVIDISFYRKLVDDAIAAIEEYGNFDEFVA